MNRRGRNGLHCVPNPGVALAEIARCLRSAGWLVKFAVRVRGTRLVVQSLCGLGLVGHNPP